MTGAGFSLPPELAKAYLLKLAARRSELHALEQAGDRASIAPLCHQLAGSAGLYGYQTLGEAARAAELKVLAGADPAEALAPLYECLDQALT
jgi:HPt (histidine-containing phosphotransfer) domain-containing protein